MLSDFTLKPDSASLLQANRCKDFANIELPDNLKQILNDFYYLCGCPSVFIGFENRCVISNGWNSGLRMDKEFCKANKLLFSDILNTKTDREDNCKEIVYADRYMGACVPVTIKGVVFGYLVHGQFTTEKNKPDSKKHLEVKSVKILTKEQIEVNIYIAKRFADAISYQLEMSCDLKNEVKKSKEATDQLRIQKTFFENLFNNSPEAIVILDNEDRVIQINKEFERLFEYTREEVESKQINELIVPDKYKQEGMQATKNAVVGELVDFTTVRQTKSGKLVHVQAIGKPVVLDNNQIAVYVIYRNLTQEIWNQKSRQIIYSISEVLNSSMNTIDMIKNIEKELEQVVGTGKLFVELVAPDKRHLQVLNKDGTDFNNIRFSESLSGRVIREKRMLYLNEKEIAEAIRLNHLSLLETPKKWLGLPLLSESRILGVFGIKSITDHAEFSLGIIKLFEVIAIQLASGIAKKLKDAELKMLHRSMEQSPASVIITDLKGNIEYVNPKFSELSGYSFEEVIGSNPRLLKSGFTPQKTYEELWSTIVSGKEWYGEFLNVKKNKELYWERASLSPIKDEYGNITNFLAVKEDITKYKEFEKELLEAKDRAEESDKLKSTFLANMSHELRTPLNAVIGFSNLCNESLSTFEILEFVDLINKSGNQLLGIIEDILSFTSIESENCKVHKEEFLMANFIGDVKKQAQEKQIQENKEQLELIFKPCENYDKVLIKTDYQRLLQVVVNLIKNGLKFTKEGYVEFGYRIEGKQLCLYVKDSGVGIEESQKNVIFESFRQADSSIARTFGGTGLGLAISKKIMDLLGGVIEVESEPNVGTTFTLKLDCILSKEKLGCNKEGTQTTNSSLWPTILVVEDKPLNFRLIKAVLKNSNYNIIHVQDEKEAVKASKENQDIDVVLVDIAMPKMNGLEIAKQIKKINPDLPVIAQTAHPMNGDKDNSCDDYIAKPINKELLLSMLEQFVT